MKTYALTDGRATKNLMGVMFSYLNFWESPKNRPVKKEDLLFGAWLTTGRQLRKALKEYAQENSQAQKGTNGRSRPKQQ
jgi:hypothetical protein